MPRPRRNLVKVGCSQYLTFHKKHKFCGCVRKINLAVTGWGSGKICPPYLMRALTVSFRLLPQNGLPELTG